MLKFAPGQNFDCSECSKCCRGWRVAVDPEARAKIRGSALELRIINQTGQPALEQSNGSTQAAKKADASCVFLTPENLCSVHSEMGSEAKPWGCRLFPFRMVRTPDGVYAGVSFYCSAAQRNEGRALSAHVAELQEFLSLTPQVGEKPMPLHADLHMDWPTYRILDDFLSAELSQGPVELALGRALWSVCRLVARKRCGAADLKDALERSELALLPPDEPLILMERYGFGMVVAALELGAAAQNTALMADRPQNYPRFNWQGRLSQVRAAALEPGEEIRRYLKALVHRKFLVARRPILHNLAALYLTPLLVSFWSGLGRLGRGESDIYRAIDECEYRLLTHGRDRGPLFEAVAQSFVDQTD